MIKKANDISFTGIKFTKAGKNFLNSQTLETKSIVKKAEKKLRKFNYSNMVISGNGCSVQVNDATGLHAYKIKDIQYSIDNNITYILSGVNKNAEYCFNVNDDVFRKSAICASKDATERNNYLTSSIMLCKLLEKQAGIPLKKNIMHKTKDFMHNLIKI